MINTGKLAGLTVFITGASRGIGKAIALKAAKDGANVVIAAKTAEPHPKLPGTIYTACEEVEKAGGKGLPCIVDVRDEQQVRQAVKQAVEKFGGIDILVNNASAISLTPTEATEMKRFDLMHNINTRGTFLVSKECLPYLKKSPHPHILNISPPLNMNPIWFKTNVAYTMAKYGMSMCVLGMSEEFRDFGIGVNALWPRTLIYTAAVEMLTGKESEKYSRKPEIMADAAYAILTSDPKTTGNFFTDEDVLKHKGITDFERYCIDPSYKDQLMMDSFIDEQDAVLPTDGRPSLKAHKIMGDGRVVEIFKSIESGLSEEAVRSTRGVFQFVVTGKEEGKWFVDLKNGRGSCGRGEAPNVDATLTVDSQHLFEIFAGQMKPATAFMTGKMRVSGNVQKVMKLDTILKSKL